MLTSAHYVQRPSNRGNKNHVCMVYKIYAWCIRIMYAWCIGAQHVVQGFHKAYGHTRRMCTALASPTHTHTDTHRLTRCNTKHTQFVCGCYQNTHTHNSYNILQHLHITFLVAPTMTRASSSRSSIRVSSSIYTYIDQSLI